MHELERQHYTDEILQTASPLAQQKFEVAQKALKNIHESLGHVIELLSMPEDLSALRNSLTLVKEKMDQVEDSMSFNSDVIEGVFDGERMISSEGQVFEVPANYASKSKLLEGDILKLSITKSGSYIFKQVSLVDRKRIVGTLAVDQESASYYVLSDNYAYRVIPASVTFYKGEVGDEVILLVPNDGASRWAAIENIIKR